MFHMNPCGFLCFKMLTGCYKKNEEKLEKTEALSGKESHLVCYPCCSGMKSRLPTKTNQLPPPLSHFSSP